MDGQPVAVEVDGSHHYTHSMPQVPLSEVLIRRQLLQVRLTPYMAMIVRTFSSRRSAAQYCQRAKAKECVHCYVEGIPWSVC